MKFSRPIFAVLLLAASITLVSKSAVADEYLFDLLAKPEYSKSWNALIQNERSVDAWLAKYGKTKNGPTSPGRTVKLNDGSYILNMVCKAHDCGDNKFYVLFSPNGTEAWGLLVTNGTTERFFGKPDEERKIALQAAKQN